MPNRNFTVWGNIYCNLIAIKNKEPNYIYIKKKKKITYFGNVWFIVWLEYWLS